MRIAGRWLGRGALVFLLTLPEIAQGQEVDAETQRLFTEGVALLYDNRFADARDRLEQARLRQELPAVVYNLAFAERGLGRYVEATRLLERYLVLADGRIDATRRAEVDDLLREVRAGIGRVTVHVAAINAEVTLDGETFSREQLDQAAPINPGHHVFRATGPELRPAEREVAVASGQVLPPITLTPTPLYVTGTLRVEPSVADASVYVDRHRVGRGVFEAEVRPGMHGVTVRAPGLPPYHADVMIVAGHVEDLRVTLTRETSIVNRWWFWTGAVLVAGAVVTGLVAGLSHTEAADGGSLGIVVQAQGSR